jgi:hypothetical protein
MQKHIITLILLFTVILGNAQNADTLNTRELHPLGVSLNLLGPTLMASANVDYFISRNVSVETGAGFFGAFVGGKVYIGKKLWKGMPYVGYTRAFVRLPTSEPVTEIFNYFPIGYHFVGKNGFNFSIEGAVLSENPPAKFLGQLRFGQRFGKKRKK